MNYEEKYKKSLDRAMNLFVTNNISATAVCEIFPELNESEEVNYEKKYKKALEWMQSLYDGLHGATKEDAEHYFPELKKNEDERIRLEIRNFIWEYPDKLPERDKWLAWFEKQSKKKSADEVLKIRQELYQSGYNDGYKHGYNHGQNNIAISLGKESIDALEHFVRDTRESGYASPYDNQTKLVYRLLEQLKQIVK